ncbi:MAG: ArsA family ATPase [Halobacteriota archaeon]
MTKLVLYGGKGGVGKTTCAAATALALAETGQRTLVVSTDPAHSLGDIFDTELGEAPTRLADALYGVEVSAQRGQEAYRSVVELLVESFREVGLSFDEGDLEALFAAGFAPGGDEVAALLAVAAYAEDDQWDRVVVDTAPTGHALRLLGLPDVLSATLGVAGAIRGQVQRLADSARSMVFGPVALFGRSQESDDDLSDLRRRLDRAGAVLTDPDWTEFRVVTTPEAMALSETSRLVSQLRDDGIPVGTIVVNRVVETVPDDCTRCRTRMERHRERLAEVRATYPDLVVVALPELDDEVRGIEAIRSLTPHLDGALSEGTDA